METKNDYALRTDLYQLSMMQTYVNRGLQDKKVVFDMFFRKIPFGNGYAVYAGLENIIKYVTGIEFKDDDLAYLGSLGFNDKFLDTLKNFSFSGNMYSMDEGEIIFPNEPILTIEARIIEALLIETSILNIFNHETLIATKASRIKEVTRENQVVEFGARRGHGLNASLYGTRATYIGGFDGTSLVEAGRRFKIPVMGTMSHAFIQSFDDELEAFRAYAEENKDNVILLVDTYNTLRSGIPNAIRVAKELEEKGDRVKGIRLDSGDLAYLSKEARKMLDNEGLNYIKIVASSDLDENVIADLKLQGAKIDVYAVGTRVITAYDQPALGGIYKLVEVIEDGVRIPKIKVSDNLDKILNPGRKKVYRIINNKTGKAEADYIAKYQETLPTVGKELLLFDPISPWKKKIVGEYRAIELQKEVLKNGQRCGPYTGVEQARRRCQVSLELLWEEHRRRINPQTYYVDLSEELWHLKKDMIEEKRSHYNDG